MTPIRRTRRRWLAVALLALALVLAGSAYVVHGWLHPYSRDARPMSQLSSMIYSNLDGVLRATAAPDVLPAVERDQRWWCQPTPLVKSHAYLSVFVTLYTTPAGGPALLRRAEAYQAAHPLTGISQRARLRKPGAVSVSFQTDCAHEDVENWEPTHLGPDDQPESTAMLAAAGLPDRDRAYRWTIPCPGGGSLTTEEAAEEALPPTPAALRPPADATTSVVIDTPSVYAFRRGGLSYVVTFEPTYTHVDITRSCLPEA